MSARKALFILISVTLVARLIASFFLGLGYGEAYYFSFTTHPSLSYFDQPPLVFWIGALLQKVTGVVHPFVLRFPIVLFFAGSTCLLYWIGKRLFGAWTGFYAALLFNLSAVFSVSVGFFFQPDGPLFFFWLACTAVLVRIFFDQNLRHPLLWWLLAGVFLGLAGLSKYHALFLVLGAALFVLTSSNQRRWLKHPGPYIALAVALLFFSPVLLWNATHNWISFLWQGHRGFNVKGIHIDWLLRSIIGQALWILPWIWAPLVWQLFRCFRQRPKQESLWFIGWMAVFPIALFTLISLYATVGYHFHWQAPGYLLLFVPLGEAVHVALKRGSMAAIRWLQFSTALLGVVFPILMSHIATGWGREVASFFVDDAEKIEDPTLEMLDYWTLEAKFREFGWMGRDDLFVFTNRWFQSGKVDFALGGKLPVLCLSEGDPRSFAFWRGSEEFLGKDGILVATERKLPDPFSYYQGYFEEIIPMGTLEVPRGKFTEETLTLYYCKALKKPYPIVYR